MSNEQIFALPIDNHGFLGRLIDAIPDTWSDMSGFLEAPAVWISAGKAMRDTGYRYGRFDHNVEISGRAHQPPEPPIHPDPVAIIIGGKEPGFLSFSETGYDSDRQFFMAKRLSAGFVRKGYRGWLTFNNGKRREYAHQQPARLDLHLQEWSMFEDFSKPRRPMPPAAVLSWNESYGGKLKQLDEILRVCQTITMN